MAKKVLTLHLNEGTYALRLTVGGQKALRKRFGDSALNVVLAAVDDLDKTCAVLGEALNWTGNPNSVTDGEAFYDLLVDNDYCGMGDWMSLMCDICVCSGLLSERQGQAVKAKMAAGLDDAIDSLFDESGAADSGEKDGGKPRPTQTAKA